MIALPPHDGEGFGDRRRILNTQKLRRILTLRWPGVIIEFFRYATEYDKMSWNLIVQHNRWNGSHSSCLMTTI